MLHTEEDCRVYWENMRWNGKPTCPHCGSISEHYYKHTQNGGKGMYKFKDRRCRCIVRHGTMFEGGCRLESGSMRFVCSSRARKISSCLLAKEIHVISYYWGESAQRLNRHYRRPECLWHLYMRITDTRLSRTAGISVDGLPLELDRGILESYQTRHKRHLLPCWRVVG